VCAFFIRLAGRTFCSKFEDFWFFADGISLTPGFSPVKDGLRALSCFNSFSPRMTNF